MDLEQLLSQYNDLCEDNDWQVYHTPKNLASAITVQAAKILEHFQWVTEEESLSLGLIPAQKKNITEGISSTFFLLLALANKTGINLEQAIKDKAARDKQQHQGIPDELLNESIMDLDK